MQNLAEAGYLRDERLDPVFEHLQSMHRNLSAEDYFHVLEGMIEKSRELIQALDNPDAQQELYNFYCQVIDYAVKLKLEDACPA